MNVRYDRIARVQERMRQEGFAAIVVMNHDDYRYLFGTDRTQPRAIVPAEGPPTIVAFEGEEPELRATMGGGGVLVFGSVGGQIHEIVGKLREIIGAPGPADLPGAPTGPPAGGRPKVGMQMWFDTPAFLVELFRKVNPGIELVSSDAVMDPLRMVKDDDELALMAEAQRAAGIGMDRARELLRPGVTAHEVATEVTYAMMRAGAERTSTPIYITFGIETCMLHGRLSAQSLQRDDLVVIDLTPQVEGYCANLARTFVLGEPDGQKRALLDAYAEVIPAVRDAMRPEVTVAQLDAVVGAVLERHGLGAYHVLGIGHGLGLRFEETPASTIIPPHRNVPLREGMTMTIGHTILAIPGLGGVRHEDVYRVTPTGGEILRPYPIDPVVAG
ncbi:MAG TPA: Xaa-Pro peptidase family protein [Candidatus Nanopelagicales bacterium]|nr:Xaa-Pro peptidase family protein [Candidatus Nanopelagicales bacterium]